MNKEEIIQNLKNLLDKSQELGNQACIISKESSKNLFGIKLSKMREKAEENGIFVAKHKKGYLVMYANKISFEE